MTEKQPSDEAMVMWRKALRAWQRAGSEAAAALVIDRHLTRAEPVEIPADIRECVLSMGRVEWGATAAKSDEDHVSGFSNSLMLTREFFATEGPQQMHGLYLEGAETVLCHTGTSPNSPLTARALTGVWNWLHNQASGIATPSTPTTSEPASPTNELVEHFRKMIEAAANYVEPCTYIARHPINGGNVWGEQFEEPSEHQSEEGKQHRKMRRDQAFINDMIHMLDGPEQRAALRATGPSEQPAGVVGAATKLVAVFDELKSTTTAERIITGRSDRDLRVEGDAAMTQLRAALAALRTDSATLGKGE